MPASGICGGVDGVAVAVEAGVVSITGAVGEGNAVVMVGVMPVMGSGLLSGSVDLNGTGSAKERNEKMARILASLANNAQGVFRRVYAW